MLQKLLVKHACRSIAYQGRVQASQTVWLTQPDRATVLSEQSLCSAAYTLRKMPKRFMHVSDRYTLTCKSFTCDAHTQTTAVTMHSVTAAACCRLHQQQRIVIDYHCDSHEGLQDTHAAMRQHE
jgi:hypothetical protein